MTQYIFAAVRTLYACERCRGSNRPPAKKVDQRKNELRRSNKLNASQGLPRQSVLTLAWAQNAVAVLPEPRFPTHQKSSFRRSHTHTLASKHPGHQGPIIGQTQNVVRTGFSFVTQTKSQRRDRAKNPFVPNTPNKSRMHGPLDPWESGIVPMKFFKNSRMQVRPLSLSRVVGDDE